MSLNFSGLGADKKKLAILGVLLAVAAYFYFSGGSPSDTSTNASRAVGTAPPVTSPRIASRLASRTRLGQAKSFRNAGEFKPSLKPNKDETLSDRNSIDPTLHEDLLARLKSVKLEGGRRSVFDFGAAQPAAQLNVVEPKKIAVVRKPVGPMPPPPPAPPPPPPQAPPVPLKFYGFVNQNKSGVKRAFFLDGDDIIVASEGQTIKSRYKIVRIGINSAVVEDIQFQGHQQTLPLVEEMPG